MCLEDLWVSNISNVCVYDKDSYSDGVFVGRFGVEGELGFVDGVWIIFVSDIDWKWDGGVIYVNWL